MTNEGRWELPSSWQWARASEFSTVVGGGTPKNAKAADNFTTEGIPWITPADLSGYSGTHISRGGRDLSKTGFASCSARLMPEGTVLLSSRAPVGYCAVASNAISTNQGFKSFVLRGQGIVSEYLRYYLIGSKQYLESEASGTTFLELSGGRAEQLLFPIAPTGEQERIVSKLDELFSRIDEGERALERVSMLVERYRQSVLKAAVTGELTRAWREKNKDKLESGEALLARILKARREAWEQAELKKMNAKGIKPANDNWKQKYPEPVQPDIADLSELPAGWVWATLDQLSTLITSGSRGWSEHYAETGSVFIRAQNIKHDVLDLNDIAFVNLTDVTEGTRTRVAIDDLLITITGANVTKAARVTGALSDAYVSQHVALVRPVIGGLSKLLHNWIVSPANGRKLLLSVAYGAGKPGLSLACLRQIPVPVYSLLEQEAISDRVALELGRLEAILKDRRQRHVILSKLRQSVLKSAFSGTLVAQRLADEPASTLLERIAAERGTDTAAPARSRKKKTA